LAEVAFVIKRGHEDRQRDHEILPSVGSGGRFRATQFPPALTRVDKIPSRSRLAKGRRPIARFCISTSARRNVVIR
jgi:hypothetical protein